MSIHGEIINRYRHAKSEFPRFHQLLFGGRTDINFNHDNPGSIGCKRDNETDHPQSWLKKKKKKKNYL